MRQHKRRIVSIGENPCSPLGEEVMSLCLYQTVSTLAWFSVVLTTLRKKLTVATVTACVVPVPVTYCYKLGFLLLVALIANKVCGGIQPIQCPFATWVVLFHDLGRERS